MLRGSERLLAIPPLSVETIREAWLNKMDSLVFDLCAFLQFSRIVLNLAMEQNARNEPEIPHLRHTVRSPNVETLCFVRFRRLESNVLLDSLG
jgi:hypothetical protein